MAQKVLRESEVNEMKARFNKISLSIEKDKEKQLSRLFEEIESGFEYIGCSAIEDKLQDGVPETIETLMNANIRIWILTGDKKVTNKYLKIKLISLGNSNRDRKVLQIDFKRRGNGRYRSGFSFRQR